MQETLERSATDAQLNDIKALLGRMMFTGKAVHKKVRPQIHSCMHHVGTVENLASGCLCFCATCSSASWGCYRMAHCTASMGVF